MRRYRSVPAWVKLSHVFGLCLLFTLGLVWVSYEMERVPQELARGVILGCIVALLAIRVWELIFSDA
jgi:hypothetical protein